EDETGTYGLTAENRHMVECFRKGQRPMETFDDGVAVMELLMALYCSAEIGQVVKLPATELETYVPKGARGGGSAAGRIAPARSLLAFDAASIPLHDHRMHREDLARAGIDGHADPVHVRAAEGLQAGEVLDQVVLPDERLVELEEVRVTVHEEDL